MDDEEGGVDLVSEWLRASTSSAKALEGLSENDLHLRGGPDGWSIGENVHHLVESYLAACTIVIAAVGKDDHAYDCSWMNLEQPRVERMGYGRLAIGPAVEVIVALGRYVAALLNAAPDALRREVKLLAAPGTEPYVMTVEEMIRQEVDHVQHHLRAVAEATQQR